MKTVDVPIDPIDVLDQLDIKEIVDYFGVENLLDEIGKFEAIYHFNLDVVDPKDE